MIHLRIDMKDELKVIVAGAKSLHFWLGIWVIGYVLVTVIFQLSYGWHWKIVENPEKVAHKVLDGLLLFIGACIYMQVSALSSYISKLTVEEDSSNDKG